MCRTLNCSLRRRENTVRLDEDSLEIRHEADKYNIDANVVKAFESALALLK